MPSTLTTARIGEGLDPGDKREKAVPSPPPPLPVVVKLMGCGPSLGGFQFWRRHFGMTLRKCLNLTMPQFCHLEYLQLWGLNELSVKHRGGSWHVESPGSPKQLQFFDISASKTCRIEKVNRDHAAPLFQNIQWLPWITAGPPKWRV